MKLSDKKFREYFEKKVRMTIRKYSLFRKNDRIAVAVSGGKDSTACLYILKKLGYNVEAVTVDPGIKDYSDINIRNLERFCSKHKIKLNIIFFSREFGLTLPEIKKKLKSKGFEYSSCMLCGILRRYLINRHSKGFDYVATGHNLDDEAQSFIMNVFRNDFRLAHRQGPKPGLFRSNAFIQRVKPLYLMLEKEVERYSKSLKFPVNYNICPASEGAFRREFAGMLDGFEKKYPSVKYNIIRFQESMSAGMNPAEEEEVNKCESCGEPSAGKVCNACRILAELKD